MSDVETVQRERGWRECEYEDGWHSPKIAPCEQRKLSTWCLQGSWPFLPDPLADTPDGWWEFGQTLKWAHEKGWVWAAEPYIGGDHQVDVFGDDEHIGYGYGDFRTSIIAALAEAVRHESEAKG